MMQTDLAFPIFNNIVIGCPGNSKITAAFYARLLQVQVIREGWLMIAKDRDAEPRLAFDEDDAARRCSRPLGCCLAQHIAGISRWRGMGRR